MITNTSEINAVSINNYVYMFSVLTILINISIN